ncbi:hypothetical protein BDV12DRAFT_61430 [Aspergillus spectabilis]
MISRPVWPGACVAYLTCVVNPRRVSPTGCLSSFRRVSSNPACVANQACVASPDVCRPMKSPWRPRWAWSPLEDLFDDLF